MRGCLVFLVSQSETDASKHCVSTKEHMKLLQGLLALTLLILMASPANAGVGETSKANRITPTGSPAFPDPKYTRPLDQCEMMKPTPVTRIYETHSKGRNTVARASSDIKCHTMIQKKRPGKGVDSVLACKVSGTPVECGVAIH
ncbi:hypothetical protein DB346_23330 [Verrucomicrobia bacterium LW23]|nr:hypothetical protein DB346_23330 [Verrucomicrobia bacterium LW23]